ncbi:TPA: hypothetical protein L6E37_003048 [Legionella pneumophila]|nr:hypothetical protein [Legionella pneumophila]
MINVDVLDTPVPIHLNAPQLKRVHAANIVEPGFSSSFSFKQYEESIEDLTPVTLNEYTEPALQQLNQEKYSLIDRRNQILASFVHQFSPFSKKTLTKIDKQIELLDEKIYSIESQNLPSEEDLNSIVEKAQRRFDLLTQETDDQKEKVESIYNHR